MALQGFNETYYLNEKLVDLAAAHTEWVGQTTDFLKSVLVSYGMTPEEHYTAYGYAEGNAPNAYFNAAEYTEAKANALFATENYATTDQARTAFLTALNGVDVYQHYLAAGAAEGLNPSNAFDESSYFTDKLAALTTAGTLPEGVTDVDSLRAWFAANGLTAVGHFEMIGGTANTEGLTVTPVPAAEKVNAAAATTNPGLTYTFTTETDNFTGTNGEDTFIGDNITTGAGDTIDGGAGIDTLKLYATNTEPNHSNIEIIELNGNITPFDVSDNAGVTTLKIVNPNPTSSYTIANGQDVSISTVASGETVDINGNTVTALDLTLNGVAATGADATIDLNSAAQTALSITTETAASQITLLNTGAKLSTVNIAGDQNLEFGSALTTITTIDASAATGNVNVDAIGASALTFTGGTGNDSITMGATLTGADILDGGAGTDTLGVSAAFTATTSAKVSNFETVKLDAALVQNLAQLNANNTLTGLVLSEAAAGVTTVTGINDATAGNIALKADNTTTTLTVASHVAGGTTDSASLAFSAGTNITTLNMANVDDLTINSASAAGVPAPANESSITSLNAGDLDKLTITGDQSFEITTAAATSALTEVDASGLTVETGETFELNTVASAIAAIKVTGTAQDDVINISNGATSGTIYTGGGNDVLGWSNGNTSTLVFTAEALGTSDLAAGTTVNINFAVTAGDHIFNMTTGVENALNFGGVNLGASAANVNINAGLSATNNIGYTEVGADSFLQIDLNGDGAYTATDDFQIKLVGASATLTGVQYNAATDAFVTV